MTIAYVPLLVAILGVILWVLFEHATLQRMGEHMFWTGVLVTLLSAGNRNVLNGHIPLVLSLGVAAIGALLWVPKGNSKRQRIGEHLFWTGLLVTLLANTAHTFSVG